MSSVGIINIFLAILVVFEYRGFRKNFIHFSANTFPISTVVISLGNYIGNLIDSKKCLTSMTVLNMMTSSRESNDLRYYFGIF